MNTTETLSTLELSILAVHLQKAQDLIKRALSLPEDQRAQLVQPLKVYVSQIAAVNRELDAAWGKAAGLGGKP